MGLGESRVRNNEALLFLMAKWLKQKLLGRAGSHAALEFKQGTFALGQGSLPRTGRLPVALGEA